MSKTDKVQEYVDKLRAERERENRKMDGGGMTKRALFELIQELWWFIENVNDEMKQAADEPTRLRLKRELEYVEMRLRKVKRGLLY